MKKNLLLATRLTLSFIFLWAFFDKLLGLGFSTAPAKAWISGGEPTRGFLLNGTHGPLAPMMQQLAGSAVVDWLFMLGLLGIGLSLLLGRWLSIAGMLGAALMLLMFVAALPPENNPLVDEHIVYALILLFFAFAAQKKKISDSAQ